MNPERTSNNVLFDVLPENLKILITLMFLRTIQNHLITSSLNKDSWPEVIRVVYLAYLKMLTATATMIKNMNALMLSHAEIDPANFITGTRRN